MSFRFEPIGVMESCFKEKFGIPRQPGLAPGADGVIQLNKDPFLKTALKSIEGFSHLWVIFVFHQHDAKNWKPSIRPPRLGGAKKVGVLASRSPHRPNPIGLSVVKLSRVDLEGAHGPRLYVEGVDLLDGTPVLDIKPYLPYADSIPGALSGWAEEAITRTPVDFSEKALEFIAAKAEPDKLRALITQMLELDPRPAFQSKKLSPSSPAAQGLRFGFKLLDYDVRWEISSGRFLVFDVVDLD